MEIHHKGTLCFIDGENKYYDGEIDYFDWCNPTDLSLGYLNDCAQMLGYNEFITYHWRIPGNDLNDGLFKIEKDDDATIISLYVPDNRVVEIYFEHSSEFELAQNVENSEDDCFIDSEYDLDDGDDGLVEIEVSSKIDMTSINESKERDKRKEKMIDTKPTRGSHDSLDNELASEFGYSSDVSDQLYLEYATSDNDSHFPRKRKHPEFDAGIDMKNPGFVVGMIFKDFDEFKNVCRQYSLVNQLGINFKHNDKDRVDVRCKEGCPFRIWASKMPDKMTVQIKSIVDEHSCSKIFENKFASVELLAYKFLDVFRDDPNMKVNTFLAKVRKELKLEIKWMKGYRTKVKALEILRGKDEDQYSKLPNSIVDVRDKPILTMLEAINSKLMRRIYKRRDAMKRYNGSICPKIQKKLDKLKIEPFNCIPDWSGGYTFQVRCPSTQFVVDMNKKTCSCRRWQLSGLPCSHAISCIFNQREHLEDYVDDCYKVTTFLKIYDYTINPIAGEDQWDFVQQGDAIIPPELLKSKRGRHQTKRRKDIVEIHEEKEKKNNLSKLSRK
ncbi:hypothetical protein V6N11_029034 [Hibiscus sabdariffa]|uniref:SWIM-type domain-containing protein n=2 Tax=Hibiscus sabdariffa TaxID=183260 RepID=A0ABR2NWA5_9ROSI